MPSPLLPPELAHLSLWQAVVWCAYLVAAVMLPLYLSVFLDMLGRIGRVLAMWQSQRRWASRTRREAFG